MREARLVGLSQDGRQLVLAMAETGEEFAVPVDDRLRAALCGDRARLGQLEIHMESALRPREIQARIRAGESPEAVAAIAQMPMERVMAFAIPVLNERSHIASLAQRASVRRPGGGDAPTRNLGAWVTDRLRTRQVDPASAEWDAWRREDTRWAVRVSYFVASEDESERKDEKVALFAYDALGRYAVPDDDEARWLVGEQAQVLPPPVQPQPQPGERRLSAVADIDPTLAPDHGSDSYEAGFEDTVSLRRRNHPAGRDDHREPHREFPRDNSRDNSRDLSRDNSRDSSRDLSRDLPRDNSRDSSRDVSRNGSREAERGPRRVHPVPNPDEEPTLIDVPADQSPAPRPAVRAVERPSDPPTFASPASSAARATPDRPTPDRPTRDRPTSDRPASDRSTSDRSSEERRGDRGTGDDRFGQERRSADRRGDVQRDDQLPAAEESATEQRTAQARSQRPEERLAAQPSTQAPGARPEEHVTEQRSTSGRGPVAEPAVRGEQTPGSAQSASPANPAAGQAPAAPGPAEHAPAEQASGEQAAEPTPAEPKKKAARKSKRASVPSWDEIMFGKKAD